MKKVFSLFATLLLFTNIYSQEVTFWSDIPNDELATLITDQMTNTELYSQILMFGWAGAEPEEILYQWVKRGLALGSAQHNTKQFMHDGTLKRHDCFIIKGGIKEPSVEWVEKPLDEPQHIPISNYTVDDDAQIDEIFGDDNDNTL